MVVKISSLQWTVYYQTLGPSSQQMVHKRHSKFLGGKSLVVTKKLLGRKMWKLVWNLERGAQVAGKKVSGEGTKNPGHVQMA